MMDKKTIISAFGVAVVAALAISSISYGDEDPASIQHRYMTPSMSVSTNTWLSVSGRVERAVADATDGLATKEDVSDKADKTTLDNHIGDDENPHGVTAAQTGAIPLVEDLSGKKTAATIGGRTSIGTVGQYSLANGQFVNASGYNSHAEGEGTTASGQFSHSEGQGTTASGYFSHAEGYGSTASGHFSHAEGYESQTSEGHQYSFAWNGDTSVINRYSSHGAGTFNINPLGGLEGFYIGELNLSRIISSEVAFPFNLNYVQIGTNSYATPREDGGAIAIGENAKALGYRSISIGGGTSEKKAVAEKSGAIQIGIGSNSSNNTLQVYGYRLLDANGYIPKERIAQTTLMLYDEKNSVTWQMGIDPNTGDMMWYAVTNVDISGSVKSIPEDRSYVPTSIQ